jgi:MYXO-CTERM domain-containing protein
MENREEKPHDVLAAEEFTIGTRDDRYPRDPYGIREPHDVLAAEEFAMPAGHDTGGSPSAGGLRSRLPLLVLAGLLLLLLRRRRS